MLAIFDLDGTLIDSAPDIHAAAEATAREAGLPGISLAQVHDFVGNGARVFIERFERAVAGGNEPERTDHLHARFLVHYTASHDLTRPYPGVVEAIAELRGAGWRLGICTNKPTAPTKAALAHLGWEGWFEVVIAGDTLPVRKPDPAPLQAAIAALASPLGAGPLLYVGDSETDAATAEAAGVAFALFTEGYRKSTISEIRHDRAFSDWSGFAALAAELAR